MSKRLTLILGGARSGKSMHAESLAAAEGGDVLYVATAEASDDEMAARISAHRTRRPAEWRLIEAPVGVSAAIQSDPKPADVVVVDCLTLLANNVFSGRAVESASARDEGEAALLSEVEQLLRAHAASEAHWILVSNEVGLGLVPPFPLGRAYRDALGRANQRLAQVADEVLFMVAGLPMRLKG